MPRHYSYSLANPASASPGWHLVVRDGLAVALPANHAIRAVWAVVEGGGSADDVLDALSAGGIRATPEFVIVDADPDGLGARLLVRGGARVTFGESPLATAGVTTWVEHRVESRDALRVTFADGGASDSVAASRLPLVCGVVVAGVLHGSVEVGAAEVESRAAESEPIEAPEDATVFEGDGPIDVDDDLESTVLAADFDAAAAARSVDVVLPDGVRHRLSTVIVIGRAPTPADGDPASTTLVTLTTPRQAISRSHLRITSRAGRIEVTDLGSRNGTRVTEGSGTARRLEAHLPTAVAVGTRLDLGDGATVQIVEAESA